MGEVIRSLRKKYNLTQAELGRRVGYMGGAGVSVSRLENGQMAPSDERLMALARELDVELEELVTLATERTESLESRATPSTASIQDRIAQIERAKETRRQLADDMEALSLTRTRANDEFLLRLQQVAGRLTGTPTRDPQSLGSDLPAGDDAAKEAALQIQFTRFGVERALAETRDLEPPVTSDSDSAFAAFAGLVSRSSFALGSILSSGAGAAAVGALQRTTGMRPMRGTSSRVAAILAAAAGAAMGWHQATARRKSKQQKEFAEAESEIAQTQPAVDALVDLVPKANGLMEYVAVHASHALRRWEAEIGEQLRDWESLTKSEQRRYDGFVEIAAAHLAVATLDFDALLTTEGEELKRAKTLTDEVLEQSRIVITAQV